MSFNLREYLNKLVVSQDDEDLASAKQVAHLTLLLCDDPWLARQAFFGMTSAMERQVSYLGEVLLPKAEKRIQTLGSPGVMKEDLVVDHWFGTTNETATHINDERNNDQRIDDARDFADRLRDRMRRGGIIYVVNKIEHDMISADLDQLSYHSIQTKSANNRKAQSVKQTAIAS